MSKFNWKEFLAMVGAWAFTPVFLLKAILNNTNCITILEPIWWIRWPEIIIVVLVMIYLGKRILKEVWTI